MFSKSIFFLFLISLAFSEVRAQSTAPISGFESIALSNADVARETFDPLGTNPALSIDSTSLALRTLFTPQENALSDAMTFRGSAYYLFPDSLATIGGGFQRFQYQSLFSDQTLALSVSKQVRLINSLPAAFGFRARYETESFGGSYAPLSTVLIDVGTRFQVSSQIALGIAAKNLFGSSYTSVTNSHIPYARSFVAGIAFQPEQIPGHIMASIEEDQDQQITEHFGADYAIDNMIAIFVGTTTDPSMISGGLRLSYSSLQLNFAAVHHSVLGTTLSLGLAWRHS